MSERDTKALLAAWGRQGVPVEEAARADERRPRVVAGVARAIRTQATERQRRARRWRVVAALSLAAVVALAVGLSWRSAGRSEPYAARITAGGDGVTVVRAGSERPVLPTTLAPLASGDAIATSQRAGAELDLNSGAKLRLAESTGLELLQVGRRPERVRITRGTVAVTVPPLGAAGRFAVLTPDATVTVHGTVFEVSVASRGGRTVTRVSVTEGIVEVEHAAGVARLERGASWSSADARAASTQTAVAPTPPLAPPPPASATRAAGSAPKGERPKVTATALAEQNRLFAAAVAARRAGDDGRAVALLDQLLSKHADSPLAPEARVERFRALKRMGKSADAAQEARRYLLEHGSGAAREEARELAIPGK